MTEPDQLPDDQRTVLTLLVGRGMSYERAASVLGVSESAVRDRAHVALALLAPAQARELSDDERGRVADYMLGQDSDSDMQAARELMESSPAASAWAHTLSGALEPFSQATVTASAPQAAPEAPASAPAPRSSRRAGALLLGGVAVAAVIAVVLILVLSGGGSGSSGKGSDSASHSQHGPKIVGRATLSSPTGAHTVGEVFILQEGAKRAYYIAAVGLPATEGFFYALWLYNSQSDAKPLNRTPKVTKNGKLAGGALLPAGAQKYHEMLLTRETHISPAPKEPGAVVLRGKLKFSG